MPHGKPSAYYWNFTVVQSMNIPMTSLTTFTILEYFHFNIASIVPGINQKQFNCFVVFLTAISSPVLYIFFRVQLRH